MTPQIPGTIGLATLAAMIYDAADRTPVLRELNSRLDADPRDAAALLDLSMLAQLNGDRERGLALQASALDITRVFRCLHGDGSALSVLALFARGDFMANTPLDFLFEGANATVYYAYLDVGESLTTLSSIDHDVVFLGVAESDANRRLLEALSVALHAWSRPVINVDGQTIIDLKRDSMWKLFVSSATVAAPRNTYVLRNELACLAGGVVPLDDLLPGDRFPIIVRPVDSHAGHGLSKVDDALMLRTYLAASDHDTFYIAPFIDYRSADNRFRKYRIVFIAGRAFLVHLAISDNWMVHYLNARMHEDAGKRVEEAECMLRFDEDFSMRHAEGLRDVAARVPLDYFAIDCAESRDGRLLLFEAGTGMIVHALDSPDLFPYKQRQMQKIFAAFLELVGATALRSIRRTPGALIFPLTAFLQRTRSDLRDANEQPVTSMI